MGRIFAFKISKMKKKNSKQFQVRFKDILNCISVGIYGKGTIMSKVLLCAIAGESMFILGPPGTAKSLIARRLKSVFKDAKAFEYLMSRFSTPDEIFGPVSISKLKNEDKYERLVEDYLPDASVVFLDEIWKAGPAIQNSLLTAINERVFKNGTSLIKLPMKVLIAASNELPEEDQGLEALWDRFLIRVVSNSIDDESLFFDMVKNEIPLEIELPDNLVIHEDEYNCWQMEIKKILIPDDVCSIVSVLRKQLIIEGDKEGHQQSDFYVSDRRWKKVFRLMQTSAFLNGRDVDIWSSSFTGNNATNGGAVYIEGDISVLNGNKFLRNNVTNQGGAVYIDGHNSTFRENNFTENEAVPLNKDDETGLGGAIFVHGDMTKTIANNFTHNKARNGSAIYTDGTNFNLTNDIFYENQAWSYLLIVTADPEESLYQSSDIEINVVHRGGDNIINAIHNHNADPNQIKFLNVTYVNSNGETTNTGENRQVSPVNGVENSQDGRLLYQDDREDYQLIQLKVTHEDGEVFYNVTDLRTNIYGNVNTTLNKANLRKGLYIVDAEHVEDWNYKFIVNVTSFRILDSMDISINKSSDKDEYFQDEISKWNLTIKNADNGTDAEYVTITDYLPDIFKLTNLTYSFYNASNDEWTNGTLDLSTSTFLVTNVL